MIKQGPFHLLDPTGREHVFSDLRTFALNNALSATAIMRVIHGRIKKTSSGWRLPHGVEPIAAARGKPPRRSRSDPYELVDPTGTKHIFTNIMYFSLQAGISFHAVRKHLRGPGSTPGWHLPRPDETFEHTVDHRGPNERVSLPGTGPYEIADSQGRVHRIDDLTEFAQLHRISYEGLYWVLTGLNKTTADGWHRPGESSKKIIHELRDPQGRIHHFANVSAFNREHQVGTRLGIYELLNGNLANSNGWTLPDAAVEKARTTLKAKPSPIPSDPMKDYLSVPEPQQESIYPDFFMM